MIRTGRRATSHTLTPRRPPTADVAGRSWQKEWLCHDHQQTPRHHRRTMTCSQHREPACRYRCVAISLSRSWKHNAHLQYSADISTPAFSSPSIFTVQHFSLPIFSASWWTRSALTRAHTSADAKNRNLKPHPGTSWSILSSLASVYKIWSL